jgi:hypothetical protein
MRDVYPGKYINERGEEIITIENDGQDLSIVIRGIRFEGSNLSFLHIVDPLPLDEKQSALFSLTGDELINYELEFEMPIPVAFGNETWPGILHVRFRSEQPPGKNIDEKMDVRLVWANHEIPFMNIDSGFDGLYLLQKAMPHGHLIKCCLNCAFSEYSPLNNGSFACFRNNKQGILAVRSKSNLFRVWNSMTEYVQETHLCSEFQSKI